MSVPPPPPPVAPNCPRCGAPNLTYLQQCPHCGTSLLAAWPPPPGGYVQPYPGYPPPSDNTLGGLIPTKNGNALTSYYLGIFSIIPCLAIPMGIAAVVLGLRGLKLYKEHPEVRGRTHAWVGIVTGGLFALINVGLAGAAVVAGVMRH